MEGRAILIGRRSVLDAQRRTMVSRFLRRDAGRRGWLLSTASIQGRVAGNESCLDDRPWHGRRRAGCDRLRRVRLFAETVWSRRGWLSGGRVARATVGKDTGAVTKASPRLPGRYRTRRT